MSDPASVAAIVPVLRVADVARAAAWYADHLGFVVEDSPVASADAVLLQRDGIALMLRRRTAEPSAPRSLLTLVDWDVYLRLDGGALLTLLDGVRRRTPLVRGPEVMPDGTVEFELEDPDGHRVCLAERIADTRGIPHATAI